VKAAGGCGIVVMFGITGVVVILGIYCRVLKDKPQQCLGTAAQQCQALL
jgi:hypothetical protein